MTGLCAPNAAPDDLLIGRIVEHEGIKKFAYKDTLGYITAGVGRCLQEGVGKGLSIDEIFFLLRNDIADFRHQLKDFDWFKNQDDVRQGVLIELCFNLGLSHLLGFKNMLAALLIKNYPLAVKELCDSAWSKQVSAARVNDIKGRLLNGRYS